VVRRAPAARAVFFSRRRRTRSTSSRRPTVARKDPGFIQGSFRGVTNAVQPLGPQGGQRNIVEGPPEGPVLEKTRKQRNRPPDPRRGGESSGRWEGAKGHPSSEVGGRSGLLDIFGAYSSHIAGGGQRTTSPTCGGTTTKVGGRGTESRWRRRSADPGKWNQHLVWDDLFSRRRE